MRVCVNTFTALPLLHRRAEASYFSLVLEGGVFLKMSEYSEISIFWFDKLFLSETTPPPPAAAAAPAAPPKSDKYVPPSQRRQVRMIFL